MKSHHKKVLPNMFKTRPKVQNEENYISSYVNVSFVHDDEIRRKSIELFYQMINHEIEHTSNIEHVSSNFVCTTGGSNRRSRTNYFWVYICTNLAISQVPDGLGVRISGFHPDGPGSIPGLGASFLFLFFCFSVGIYWNLLKTRTKGAVYYDRGSIL